MSYPASKRPAILGEQVLTHAHVACLAERKAAGPVQAFLDVVNQELIKKGAEAATR